MKSKHAHVNCAPPLHLGIGGRKKEARRGGQNQKLGIAQTKTWTHKCKDWKSIVFQRSKLLYLFPRSLTVIAYDSWWFCGGRKICSESNHGLTRRERRPVMTLVRQCRLLAWWRLSTENSAQQHHIEKAEGLWCVLVAVMAEGEVLVGSFVKFGTAAQIPLLSEGGVTLLQCNTVTLLQGHIGPCLSQSRKPSSAPASGEFYLLSGTLGINTKAQTKKCRK